jgi:hypothetical protein
MKNDDGFKIISIFQGCGPAWIRIRIRVKRWILIRIRYTVKSTVYFTNFGITPWKNLKENKA